MSQKYSDRGAKPATGRSGSASLETRALLGKDGSTDLEVTTGQLDGVAPPRGVFEKVQIKLLTDAGDVLQTDNFRKTLSGNGYTSFVYDGLRRGQLAQVHANIKGIDPNRTDVVVVSTDVKLRPDLKAVSLTAPGQAHVSAPVTVVGTIAEINGDVGAHTTCRLLADGVEVGAVPGAWVDAGSTVTCVFQTAFSSPGQKQLTLRLSGAVPAEYDNTNNEAVATISVVEPTVPFAYFQVWAVSNEYLNVYREDRTFTRSDGAVSTQLREWRYENDIQQYGAYGYFAGNSPLDSGTLSLRHSMDGTVLPMISAQIADLPVVNWNWNCRWGMFVTSDYVQICSGWGYTELHAYRINGAATYFDRSVSTGDFYWYGNWEYTSHEEYGARIAFGSVYSAELNHSGGEMSHAETLSATLVPYSYSFDYWNNPSCWTYYDWYGYGTEQGCSRQTYHYDQIYGYNQSWH